MSKNELDYKDHENGLWLMFGDCLDRMKDIPDGKDDMIKNNKHKLEGIPIRLLVVMLLWAIIIF